MRLTVLLTLALLPLGVVSVFQYTTLASQARTMSERALLAETLRAAAAQREAVQAAKAKLTALTPLLADVAQPLSICRAFLADVVHENPDIHSAVWVLPDGSMDCAAPVDLVHHGDLTGAGHGTTHQQGGQNLLISHPLPDGTGVMIIAIPHSALSQTDPIATTPGQPVSLITFDPTGRVVASTDTPERTRALLPADMPLASLGSSHANTFTQTSAQGDDRPYAVVPVADGALYTLGTWTTGFGAAGAGGRVMAALGIVLPLLMWAASLAVAYVTISRLVLEPLGQVQRRIQAFADGNRALGSAELAGAPSELQAVSTTVESMITQIVENESRLAKSLHDQEVLLKEVHHRVKNNLQLIASILNMQLRAGVAPEAAPILQRVRTRVMGLALVYQHLYRAEEVSQIRADTLLREITNRSLPKTPKIDASLDLAPLSLYPDQAIPLALLVGEAMSNLHAHDGPPQSAPLRVTLRLTSNDNGRIQLDHRVEGPSLLAPPGREELGDKLIDAFAQQLDADLVRHHDTMFETLRLSFATSGFASGTVP